MQAVVATAGDKAGIEAGVFRVLSNASVLAQIKLYRDQRGVERVHFTDESSYWRCLLVF